MAIICHCQVVRERAVVKAIQNGAQTVDEVQAQCGAGQACGGCVPEILQLLGRHAPQRSLIGSGGPAHA